MVSAAIGGRAARRALRTKLFIVVSLHGHRMYNRSLGRPYNQHPLRPWQCPANGPSAEFVGSSKQSQNRARAQARSPAQAVPGAKCGTLSTWAQ